MRTASNTTVDFGCGISTCVLMLAEFGHPVTAVDGSDEML